MKAFFARLADRLSRSAGFFLTVLIVLCAVEVAVDWNATLYEINVLRSQLKQKAENYADLLRKAAEPSILAYDADELERLSAGLFEDEELVYVRFSDLLGNTLLDRLRPEYARSFAEAHQQTFRDHYRRPMTRDTAGIAADPIALKQKMERSRHRDFIQAFTDGENALLAKFSTPASPLAEPPPRVLYQDRLSDAEGARDVDTSYSVGSITAPDGEVYGVVLVAFRLDKLNRAVRGKLLKGLGMVVFFVGLILVQNLASRKAKLRLLDLEAAQKAARHAVRSMLPKIPPVPWGKVEVALEQADHVGGTIYDLKLHGETLEILLAVPEGDGVEAAFASVALLGQYRRLSAASLDERAKALLAAYDDAPLGRPMALMLIQIAPDGSVKGVTSGLDTPSLLDGELRQIVAGEPLPLQSRLLPPPRRFSAQLGTLIVAPDPSRIVALLAQGDAAERAVAEDRRKEDALVLIVTRSAA